MENFGYIKHVNYIVDEDELLRVIVKATPRVSVALHFGDELAWEAYLRLIYESVKQHNEYLPNLHEDGEAQN